LFVEEVVELLKNPAPAPLTATGNRIKAEEERSNMKDVAFKLRLRWMNCRLDIDGRNRFTIIVTMIYDD